MKNPKLKTTEYTVEFHFPNGFVYDIMIDYIDTERKVNEWIMHLSAKNWWSQELEDELISWWKNAFQK